MCDDGNDYEVLQIPHHRTEEVDDVFDFNGNRHARIVHVLFTPEESDLLVERYVENYETYHHTLSGPTRQGFEGKKRFIAQLTEEVNSLGHAKKTEKQVD